jgi:hypothetical protein
MITFQQTTLAAICNRRRLLCQDIQDFHASAIASAQYSVRKNWQVSLGDALLFDSAGLKIIAQAIQQYQGNAKTLSFLLKPSSAARRDYYSHHFPSASDAIVLPIAAQCNEGDERTDTLEIVLPELVTDIPFPKALTPADTACIPLGLLMEAKCEHDFLFANQIATISHIAQQVRRSPMPWLRACCTFFASQNIPLRQRIPLYWKSIHPTARVHPTAVIEGAVIGAGCRVGAHCVVRYSVLGKQVHLQDSAKVEYSVVDDQTWLMHDLVLYRSLVETHAFLIHGPYQFSYLQHGSAAFANIMMDYRPDARDIQIMTPAGVRAYKGRFLGALLQENSKVLGGTLTAPGITIPAEMNICAKAEDVVRAKDVAPVNKSVVTT